MANKKPATGYRLRASCSQMLQTPGLSKPRRSFPKMRTLLFLYDLNNHSHVGESRR